MPRADNDWGEWDKSQWDVPAEGTWFSEHLKKDETKPINTIKPATTNKRKSQPKVFPQNSSREIYYPCMKDFRQWYLWARETGRHKVYVAYIQRIAIKFRCQTPKSSSNDRLINPRICLSEADLHNMKCDEANYKEMLKQFLEDAQTIIDAMGTDTLRGNENCRQYVFKNREYTLIQYLGRKRLEVRDCKYLLAYQVVDQPRSGDRSMRVKDAEALRAYPKT